MTVAVAVDFGTTSTCVALSVNDEPARIVVIDGSPLMPSAVYADGRTLFVGAEADRQASLDPSRYEPTPKRRIDEGSLLLGDTVVPVLRAIAAVLSRAVREARMVVGGLPVDVLVLTHPADWGAVRVQLLVSAGRGLASVVRTLPEPVAAAVQHGAGLKDGAVLAVLDVGAGTADVSVLRRDDGRFRVLATRGDPSFGGADVDQLLMDELGTRLTAEQRPHWDAVTRGQGLEDRRLRRALRIDVRGAKESLSRHSYADVPLPGRLPDAHVTRADLERLIRGRVATVVDMLTGALRDAGALGGAGSGVGSECGAGVFLVGGSSRIPLFVTMVHQRLGVLPVSTDQPETVVARGALLAVAPLDRTREREAGILERPMPLVSALSSAALLADSARRPARVLPPRRPRRWWLAGAAVLVVGCAVGGTLLVTRGAEEQASRLVNAHRATMAVPASWQESRRTDSGNSAELDLTPDGTPAQAQGLFLVQTTLNPATSQADVAAVLLKQVAAEVAAGKKYEAFNGDAHSEGRDVIYYREIRRDAGFVDWYVVVESQTQVSVGCQRPADDQHSMDQPCAQAVRTVRIAGG